MALNTYTFLMLRILTGVMSLIFAVVALAASTAIAGGQAEQKGFATPQQAVAVLVNAVKDDNDYELLAVLGPDLMDLISSGDKVADKAGRAKFLQAYEEKNNFEQVKEDNAVLLIGKKDYPFPIPIVRQEDTWFFDTQAGKEEILNRRIGRNELHSIDVMQDYTAAQREYACRAREGGISEFAKNLASSEDKKDGLYWYTEEGEEESPFGPLIAIASEAGYLSGPGYDFPEPFQGYYFKILKKQGEHAKGGAFDYVADGKMVLGFAMVAYPAKYEASGIMTFIVNQEGIIYEKDLGKETNDIAAAMTTYNPDETWNIYEEPSEQ